MIKLTTHEEVTAFLTGINNATLHAIITGHMERLAEFEGYDLSELVEFVIIEPADRQADMEAALGIEGDDLPCEYCIDHGTWFEVVRILNDSGFGRVILVPKATSLPPAVRALCQCAGESIQTQ
jgi:hypothetical protein